MKKLFWTVCIILLVFCVWLLLRHPARQEDVSLHTQDMTLTNHLIQTPRSKPVEQRRLTNFSQLVSALAPNPSPQAQAVMKTNPIYGLQLAMWQAPINFYGKVVDENTNPITGANITFEWTETPTEEGNKTSTTKSDANGLFSLQDKRGPSLEVLISKEGYYASHGGHWGYSYAFGPNKISPDPSSPIIFHLHKKGQEAQLITSDYGIRNDFPVLVPRDGTPVNVDLLQRKTTSSGDLQISQLKPERAQMRQATNWSFHMRLSDGGFIEENDDFPFTAPETGYQSTIDLDFTKGDADWATQFTKDYYIVFGQPQKYGLLHIEGNIAQQTIFLKYAINPTGSRNLEPQ